MAKRSGITPTNLSLLENGKIDIGKRRAEQLAKAFDVHPATIMFPEYESQEIKKAANIVATKFRTTMAKVLSKHQKTFEKLAH
ncbi:MAG: helix-turn-helix domain-containing protein [Elusimicrobia bacterium]|nr:helix-turn-helix domain-containing protein [Candidatus Obscuribacterium magneticum]MCB4756375.1 helix-turn-helix domain-containing protein [Candidatus Obscuribacterium magneticum]